MTWGILRDEYVVPATWIEKQLRRDRHLPLIFPVQIACYVRSRNHLLASGFEDRLRG